MNDLGTGWFKAPMQKVAHYYPDASSGKSICGRVWCCGKRVECAPPNVRTCEDCVEAYWALRKIGQ